MINAKKVEELKSLWSEAIGAGGVPLYQGEIDARAFLPGQDISAYFAPATLLNIPRSCKLYFNEPFGPLDLIVTVDRIEELVAEMNVSNGNLVSSLATDDEIIAKRLQGEVRAFKFGHNVVRSRGDREELFGGLGQSWKGCFVGGSLLARSLTRGEGDDKLPGVFPTGTRLP
jgi:acyl-CoA reductase-like NAD-dependent aldehyde dehydrogenase